MRNLNKIKRLYDCVYILYVINFILNVLGFVAYLIIWGVNRGSYLDLILVFLGVSFYIMCWRLAATAASSIYKNSKRLSELEVLLAQHSIEFPKEPEPQPLIKVKATKVVEDVAAVNNEATIIKPEINDDKVVADEATALNEAEGIEPEAEESTEDELIIIDEQLDAATKREIVNLLSAGREMKALLLLVNAGIQMDVAARYIDSLKAK